jgi:PQQ-dependent dehydrogenase (methanol/ethanol family)
MACSAKKFALAAAFAACLFVSVAAEKADWNAPAGENYPMAGGNLGNQRYSALAQITPENISKLGGAWMIHTTDQSGNGSMEGIPVVVNGVMYMPTGTGAIMSINAATGAVRWKYQSPDGGSTNRGVAVGEGKVFTSGGGNSLIALDQETGELAWSVKVGDRGTTVAPAAYYDGKVYMGVSGGEAGARGHFGAFDAKTGKEVWGFWSTPAPGERGSETWEGDSWKYGGAPFWTQPAIDPELGMVYLSIGNASPDSDGSKRGGDNLYSASIVALDMRTGAYKWHFQEVHHDIWDYDNECAPVLADIKFQGRTRKILIHAGKTGFLYIYDRTNGKPLVGIEEKPVPQDPRMKTAATQPYPIGDAFVPTCPEPGSVAPGSKSSCIFGSYWDEPVVMTPGTQGGNSWSPITFDPKTGLVYVPGTILNSAFTLRRQDWNTQTNRFDTAPDAAPAFVKPLGEPRAGTMTAMDPTTDKIVWQKRMKFPLGNGSGLLTTASGLIFHGESDGRFVAYDVKNGNELWSFQTGAGADAPAITYEVNGEQYVAILAGGQPTYQLSQRGDNLWAFKLGGTTPPLPAPPEPSLTQPARGPGGGGRRGAPPAAGATPAQPAQQ